MAPSVQSTIIPPDLTAYKEEVDARFREEKEENDQQLRRNKEAGVGVPMEF
jgi:histone deacetylase HOS2